MGGNCAVAKFPPILVVTTHNGGHSYDDFKYVRNMLDEGKGSNAAELEQLQKIREDMLTGEVKLGVAK